MASTITSTDILNLAEGCPQLYYLGINDIALSDTDIGVIAKCCPQLSVVIVSCYHLSDLGLGMLAESCPLLSALCITNSYSDDQAITTAGIDKVIAACPLLFALVLPKLSDSVPMMKSQLLSFFSIQFCEFRLEGITQLVENYPQLSVLDLTDGNAADPGK